MVGFKRFKQKDVVCARKISENLDVYFLKNGSAVFSHLKSDGKYEYLSFDSSVARQVLGGVYSSGLMVDYNGRLYHFGKGGDLGDYTAYLVDSINERKVNSGLLVGGLLGGGLSLASLIYDNANFFEGVVGVSLSVPFFVSGAFNLVSYFGGKRVLKKIRKLQEWYGEGVASFNDFVYHYNNDRSLTRVSFDELKGVIESLGFKVASYGSSIDVRGYYDVDGHAVSLSSFFNKNNDLIYGVLSMYVLDKKGVLGENDMIDLSSFSVDEVKYFAGFISELISYNKKRPSDDVGAFLEFVKGRVSYESPSYLSKVVDGLKGGFRNVKRFFEGSLLSVAGALGFAGLTHWLYSGNDFLMNFSEGVVGVAGVSSLLSFFDWVYKGIKYDDADDEFRKARVVDDLFSNIK